MEDNDSVDHHNHRRRRRRRHRPFICHSTTVWHERIHCRYSLTGSSINEITFRGVVYIILTMCDVKLGLTLYTIDNHYSTP